MKKRKDYVDLIVQGLKESDTEYIPFLPDGKMRDLYPVLANDPYFKLIEVANEGDGVSIAAGLWLGGKKAALVMTNAGLRMCTEQLARFGFTHEVPVVMIMAYTGDVGERQWWAIPHGYTTEETLKALRIPYIIVRRKEDIVDSIKKAQQHASVSQFHVAVIISPDLLK